MTQGSTLKNTWTGYNVCYSFLEYFFFYWSTTNKEMLNSIIVTIMRLTWDIYHIKHLYNLDSRPLHKGNQCLKDARNQKWWKGNHKWVALRVLAVFHKTVWVCHVYCNLKLGFTCRITVMFGTLKDGSLLINTLASNICFSYRNML